MDSDIHNHNQQHQPQENMSSGLTRYRSAPSSYFSNLTNTGVYGEEDFEPFFNTRVSSPETEKILSRFISGDDNFSSQRNLDEIRGDEFMVSMKPEQVNFSSQEHQHMLYRNHARSQEVIQVDDRLTDTNLVRQSSSPAGFFQHNNIDNGYPMMRSMDKFQPAKSQTAFSSGSCSSSRPLLRIPEHEGKTMAHNNGGYVTSFTRGSWDESTMLSDGFLNEFVENGQISSSENQEKLKVERRVQSVHAPTGLTHQLSLPTSSTELSVKEKLLQFQDNVPLRSRAKRGCATHPRSIAERVRRTRISERMRKLQDLVPNMDKQTSTADMLDLAVDYIKELQYQVETLTECRTKCTCPHKQKL